MSITNGQWKKQDNSGRVGESRWSRGIGKPYQNRIRTGTIFEYLLPSGKRQKVGGRITTVSKPHLLRLLSLLIERKADSPTC
jgi:hypothetical protein